MAIGNRSVMQDDRRIAALARYRVMDTPREGGFNDLAALAAEICGTPIAAVNLIAGDRQWFKAEIGLGVDTSPLETSFCGTAILEEEFLLVPDATQDHRFACNPLVNAEKGLRFYAGALLKSSDDFAIGTLCVLDYEPRSLTEQQQNALRRLARQVTAQLELRLAMLEREEANAELGLSEERFRAAVGAVEGVLWTNSADGRMIGEQPAWAALTGQSYAEYQGFGWSKAVHPDDAQPTIHAWKRAVEEKRTFVFEHRVCRHDGAWRRFSIRAVPTFNAIGQISEWVGVHTDVTDKSAAEEQLRELNETLETRIALALSERAAALSRAQIERDRAWSQTQDLLVIAERDGRLAAVNAAWTRLLGWEEQELVGRPFADLTHPDDLAGTLVAFAGIFEAPLVVPYEYRLRHKEGHYCWFAWMGSFRDERVYASGRDTTAEHEKAEALATAENALRQSQKLEAIGQLTGGVAHDFNNLLTVIRGSVDLLRRNNLTEQKRIRYIDAIGDTADRAAKLTGQLLSFARRQALSAVLFDVAASLNEVATMLQTMTGSRIILDLQTPDDPYFIVADRSQFDTAIVNMGINARDAMHGEGRLTITTEPVSSIPPIRGHAAVAGDFVAVTIGDTGSGISPDKLDKIFEPFFTTKSVGEGTGLGLSQVIGFAKQSGGDICVDSTLGEGTRFTLYLPRANSDEAAETSEFEPTALVDGNGACVLVVEDNQDVGNFATAALRELGYDSILATDANAALAALAATPDRFHIMFSDVVMPGMNGVELAQEVRRQFPNVPVILTSGYSHVLAQDGGHGFDLLHKPYSIEQLSRVLQRAVAWQQVQRGNGREQV
ncbi:PAS domain-containing protein [Sphingomonas sp. S1-29]|uniref:PAS domain-containing protein n=1 Tax=Sphingomonas sp. S1-29 TaxID=2991074 RepID=UPI00223F4E9A|nr:PAS domain-containing protein [Sphingomonas sp. S1-29]UZK68823.1 PAS domain-containing protein [Sphingomonas sp. S1-29]